LKFNGVWILTTYGADTGATTMPNSLPQQLPTIIAEGRRIANDAVHRFVAGDGARLHTREWVFPAPPDGLPGMPPNARRGASPNRLIHGDSLSAAAAMLAGDAQQPSLRGRVGLILLDPQAGGISCAGDVVSRLAAIVPRLLLMRELLSRNGAIYIRLDELVMPYVATMVDEVFGPAIAVHAFTAGDAAEPCSRTPLPSDEVLDAVILVASDRHMVVADFLGDFGRAAVAAARYGRRWIAADHDQTACELMRRRLRGYCTDPFLYQSVA
jgi:hypothetical protein